MDTSSSTLDENKTSNESIIPTSWCCLFDIDGVLVASHELQVASLTEIMSQLAQECSLESSVPKLCPGASEGYNSAQVRSLIFNIIQGGNELSSIQTILNTFKEFQPHKSRLITKAWERYYSIIDQGDSSLPIKDSIQLLHTLLDLRIPVCLVSSSKLSDVKRYCQLLGFSESLGISIIALEDQQGQFKPSPFPYILASQKMRTPPSQCVVFEDSTIGVSSAKSAGMYVVGLHRKDSSLGILPIPKDADEIVDSLLNATVLRGITYHAPDRTDMENDLMVRVITVQSVSEDEMDIIVRQTYDMYCQFFQGRSVDAWKARLIDNKDLIARIALFICPTKGLQGYGIFKVQSVKYNGEDRLVLLVNAGMLPSCRGNVSVVRFYQLETRRVLLGWPNIPIHLFDNFLGYGGYSVILKCAFLVVPSIAYPVAANINMIDHSRFFATF